MIQWFQRHKNIVITGAAVLVVLVAAFLFSGPKTTPSSQSGEGESGSTGIENGITSEEGLSGSASTGERSDRRTTEASTEKTDSAVPEDGTGSDGVSAGTSENASLTTSQGTDGTGKSESENPNPVVTTESADTTEITTEQPQVTFHCTISISCTTILNHMDSLEPSKTGLVPADGVILGTTTVTVTEGETVYDALRRACSNAGIPLDASYSPGNGSAYVKGISNLYEFDCGSLSGWRYCVNGTYPNYGCSSYILKEGDSIQWNYTCTMNDL